MTRLTYLICVVGLCACGSGNGSGTDGGADATTRDGAAPGRDAGAVGPIPEDEHAGVLAETWCATAFECGCAQSVYPDEAECARSLTASVESRRGGFAAMGLVYDASCAARVVREIEVVGCLGYRPLELGCEYCSLYHGSVARGEPCTNPWLLATDCAPGLECVDLGSGTLTCEDRCEAFPRFVGPGEACGTGNVDCAPLYGVCEDGTCRAWPGAGEPCDGSTCDITSYCDQTSGTCVATASQGAACDDGTQCETRSCEADVCVAFCNPRPF
ncbi:MAG: hypothetical protein AB7S26_09780 [Sandaracinaceae bacterium]